MLEITTRNSSGCGAGTKATWRATFDAVGRLTMVYLNGDCPEGRPGRRVGRCDASLRDEGLPAVG